MHPPAGQTPPEELVREGKSQPISPYAPHFSPLQFSTTNSGILAEAQLQQKQEEGQREGWEEKRFQVQVLGFLQVWISDEMRYSKPPSDREIMNTTDNVI